MKICSQYDHEPQLSYRDVHMSGIPAHLRTITDRPHYCLSLNIPICGEDRLYTLLIRYYWDNEAWNHYYFGEYVMGDFEEIVSSDEIDAREQAYLDHEGNLDGFYPPRPIRGIEKDIREALIRRWEALCELVTPHTTF